nr:cell division protein ZapA [Sphingomonadaceae bacterium]
TEARQLLFAALLLADELSEMAGGAIPAPPADPRIAPALDTLAARIEAVADALEGKPAAS